MSFDFIFPLFAQATPEAATNVAEAAAAVADKFSSVDTIWVLLGAALVFFMHPGFTMVEAGFTRAKNTGNIAMKNVLTFSIGSLIFWFIGFGIMFGSEAPYFGAIDLFSEKAVAGEYGGGTYPSIVFLIFQTVFCATGATIVSGAMAERTKFSTYCIYCLVICGFIYPITGHWGWGGGWLSHLGVDMFGDKFSELTGGDGFHDFAGSTLVHLVGGVSAFVGAALLGARIGKYTKEGKPRAILGSNVALGCLGVLILWFGWFGFNGASTVSATGDDTLTLMGKIFVTTNLSAAAGSVATMFVSWLKYGKPDVSLTLNGVLAGLVGITAGCDAVSPAGAVAIGAISGVVLVFAVEFIDKVLRVDDPVGAVAVHGVCGALGTLLVGVFAESGGLAYGGGSQLLTVQAIGMGSVTAFIAVAMLVIFGILKATIGLRVPVAEEISGLDITEHGLASAYADFNITDQLHGIVAHDEGKVPVNKAVEVSVAKTVPPKTPTDHPKYSKVEIICRQNKFDELKDALNAINITGMTVTQVMGCGMQKGSSEYYRGIQVDIQLLPKVRVEVVVTKVPVELVVETAKKALYTGNIGDGKIFIYDVENVIKVRTGAEGYSALQDE